MARETMRDDSERGDTTHRLRIVVRMFSSRRFMGASVVWFGEIPGVLVAGIDPVPDGP